MMHVDPLLPMLVATSLAIFVIGLVMKKLGQPYVVGYLLAGIVLGPHVLGIATDAQTLGHLGSIGVVLLLFFVGMEISPRKLLDDWKVAVLGTALQTAISVAGVWGLGLIFDWPIGRIVLLGFVISLSSTAVVIPLLQAKGQLHTRLGGHVLGILVAQDFAIIPMLLIISAMSGETPGIGTLSLQALGAIGAVGLLVYLARKGEIRLGLERWVGDDQEMHVFASMIICFGLAFISGKLQLSTALGAFLGGILIASGKETHWIHEVLEPFRFVFVAVFFVSVGMLLDLEFVVTQWRTVTLLTALVFLTNTLINAVVLRFFDTPWKHSVYGATLLAPIGEFSFILAAIGQRAGLISDFGFQATMATITSSLILGPFWIAMTKRWAPKPEFAPIS